MPLFPSYHEVGLPLHLIGPKIAWEAQLGQSCIAKIADENGGEYYSLGTQNLVSFKPYLIWTACREFPTTVLSGF